MNRPQQVATKPQLALQSYLDGLLQEATEELDEAVPVSVEPDEFHCRIPPADVARLIAGCDLMLAPSWEQEGFGLPVLEAMSYR